MKMFACFKKKVIDIDEGATPCERLTPAYVFGNNMVLQRDKKVNVYGAGGVKGRKVTVIFNGQKKSANPDKMGAWKVTLSPMPANDVGQPLTITDGETTLVYENVLVGEVWYCSGQSNMDQ